MSETNEYIEDETINLESLTNDPVSVVNETQPEKYKLDYPKHKNPK